MSSLEFINTGLPPQTQPANNRNAIRSHAARLSRYQRCLQKNDITGSGNGEGPQWVVYTRASDGVPNGASLEASSAPSAVGLTQLESLPLHQKVGSLTHGPLQSLPAMAVATPPIVFLHSERDSISPPCELQHEQQSRPEHINNPAIAIALGAGNADPFASLPMTIEPYMWALIDHCK